MIQLRASGDVALIRELFREYQAGVDAPVCFASFDAELASLPAPYFALLVAEVDGAAAGCVALKPLPDGAAEVKRLYVRPAFRRLGLAERLMRAAASEAAAQGYRKLRLDTLPIMSAAIALYRRLGFVEIERYNDMPVANALFFELTLPRDAGGSA